MKGFILCLVAAVSLVGAQTTPYFRPGYVYNEALGTFYKVVQTRTSWRDARESCKLEGATLAIPRNAEEAEYMVSLYNATLDAQSGFFVGFYDLINEGEFTDSEANSIDNYYNEWAEGEPSNSGQEDCVELVKNGKLNDVACDSAKAYICAKSADTVEWNEACQLPDLSYVYNETLGKCYKFHLDYRNWTEANRSCRAEQSYLVLVNSDAEDQFLVDFTAAAPKESVTGGYLRGIFLAGFHNMFGDGWITINGDTIQEAGFPAWIDSQPDNATGDEYCGSVFNTGQLNDISCSTESFYICEHDVTTTKCT